MLSSKESDGVAPVFETTFTDARGAFSFDRRLQPGRYELQAARTNLPNPLMEIVELEQSRKEITVVRGSQTATIHIKDQ